VHPAWLEQDGSAGTSIGRWAAVAGTFARHVRRRHRVHLAARAISHLAAPVLCDTATNSVTFAVAWIAAR